MESVKEDGCCKMRYLILLGCLLIVGNSFAQNRRNTRPSGNPFLKTQWWLGFRAGTNIAKGVPEQSYTSFSPINYNASRNSKDYEGFSRPGVQASLEFAFYTKGFTLSFQPGFATMFYRYSTTYNWSDVSNPDNTLNQTFHVEDNMQIFDLPLLIKYDFLQGKIHPFVQIGGYYNLLISAGKEISVDGDDKASGSEVVFSGDPVSIGTTDLYNKSTGGLVGGIGVVYDAGNIRIVFDANYRYGLSNISNPGKRYSNNQLASIGDVQDDLKLQSIWFSLSVQFPLKFISKNYESVN